MHLQRHIGMRGERCVEVVDLSVEHRQELAQLGAHLRVGPQQVERLLEARVLGDGPADEGGDEHADEASLPLGHLVDRRGCRRCEEVLRSEEHTSELQSLMRISYAVFCLKKKKTAV